MTSVFLVWEMQQREALRASMVREPQRIKGGTHETANDHHTLCSKHAGPAVGSASHLGQCPAQSAEVPKKGVTPYVTHFVFRPVQNLDVSGLGTVTLLEATGTTENLKGEKMLDKMSARCEALSVNSGPKNYIDGACVLADADGDARFLAARHEVRHAHHHGWHRQI